MSTFTKQILYSLVKLLTLPFSAAFNDAVNNDEGPRDDKCFGCGEPGYVKTLWL